MIKSYEDYLYYIEEDRKALGQELKRPRFIGDLKNDIYKFERLLRKLEYIRNCKKGRLNKIYYYILRYKYQKISYKLRFEIPLNVCGPGLCLVHGGTIIINGEAQIGSNCRIQSMVNIGSNDRNKVGAPIIGNNVFIGPGAKLYGPIEIGDNIAIGANSVVNKSFLDGNVTIAGIPAKVVNRKGVEGII